MMRLLLLLSLMGPGAFAAPSAQREFNRRFASEWLKVQAPEEPFFPGSYPAVLRWFLEGVIGREPAGETAAFVPGCAPDDLEGVLRSTPQAARQAAAVEAHFRRCFMNVETGAPGRILGSLNIMRLRLEVPAHPMIERVHFSFPDGSVMHGLLALKGDDRPRPFVVLRLGIFSNPHESFVERFLLTQLFEQGPFNVLVLENTTGAQYVATNPGFAIGGGVEAMQNLHVARKLRDPAEPISRLISSLHFVGMSLGGHGLFAAAGLDPLQPGGPRIQSFVGLCPTVNLPETLARGTEAGVTRALADVWIRRRLHELADRVPALKEWPWGEWLRGRPASLRLAVDYARRDASRGRNLATGLKIPDEYLNSLGPDHDPLPYFKNVRAPFVVFATKDDDLVPPALNAMRLDALLRTDKSMNDNAAVVLFDRGFHCTLPTAYDWNTMTAVLNGTLLAAVRWPERTQSLDMDLGDVVQPKPGAVPTYAIEWPKGGAFVSLRVKIDGRDGPAEFALSLPQDDFDFKIRDAQTSEPVKRTLERWLHRFLKLSVDQKDGRSFLKISWPMPR